MDPTISLKAYWSILKTFLDNKKIPCIPPIYHNNNCITDFKDRAQIFNNFFAKQCTLVENISKRPTDSFKKTNNPLWTISFTKDDIARIIKNLNLNKVHGFDMISTRHLRWLTQSWIFWNLYLNHGLRMGNFPSNGKKLMLFQFIKK